MLSLSPFFINSFVPSLSGCDMYDLRRFDIQEEPVRHREPNYSLTEGDQSANLEVELPGVAKENVKLDLSGNKMALTAKRFSRNSAANEEIVEKPSKDNMDTEAAENDAEAKESKPEETPKPCVVYELTVRIGNRYDTENIEASMDGDGLLKLRIPMKKKVAPRNIEIQ